MFSRQQRCLELRGAERLVENLDRYAWARTADSDGYESVLPITGHHDQPPPVSDLRQVPHDLHSLHVWHVKIDYDDAWLKVTEGRRECGGLVQYFRYDAQLTRHSLDQR